MPSSYPQKTSCASYSALPMTGNEFGDIRETLDNNKDYYWNGTNWLFVNKTLKRLFTSNPDPSPDPANPGFHKIGIENRESGVFSEVPYASETSSGVISAADYIEFKESTPGDVSLLEARVSELENTQEMQDTDIVFLDERISTHTSEINSLNVSQANQDTQIAANTSAISTTSSNLSYLSTTVSGHTTSINSLNASQAVQDGKISALETTSATHTTQIASNTSAIATTNSNVSSLSTTVTGHTTSINSLNSSQTVQDGQITTLQSTTASHTTQISSLQASDSSQNTAIANINTALSGKEPTITPGTATQYWDGTKSWKTLEMAALLPVTAGTAAATGRIGEIIPAQVSSLTATGVASSGAWGSVTSITLTPGVWEIYGVCGLSQGTSLLSGVVGAGVSTSSIGVGIDPFDAVSFSSTLLSAGEAMVNTPLKVVSISSNTTYYLNSKFTYTLAVNLQHRGRIFAIRSR